MTTSRSEAALRGLMVPATGLVAVAIVWARASLPGRAPEVATLVHERMPAAGVGNPVTAVLLDFRGFDTVLEVAVLLLALTGVVSVRHGATAPDALASEAARASAAAAPAGAILQGLIRALFPVALVVAGYLWWIGSRAPGGAFQGGAVLGAAGVLLLLSGVLAADLPTRPAFRAVVASGLLGFLAVAAGTLLVGRGFLDYPAEAAAASILGIEAVLTVSIGALLASLFAFTR